MTVQCPDTTHPESSSPQCLYFTPPHLQLAGAPDPPETASGRAGGGTFVVRRDGLSRVAYFRRRPVTGVTAAADALTAAAVTAEVAAEETAGWAAEACPW